jgi:hypothetical protein
MSDSRSYLIKLDKLYQCISLEELTNLDSVEDYELIASFPFNLEVDKEFKNIESFSSYLEKDLKEDAYFREMLDLILKTHKIPHVDSRGKKTTGSLYVAVDRACGKYLVPLDYTVDGQVVDKKDPYGTKETVVYGIVTLFHRENVGKAIMRISEGEASLSSLDNETKGQMVKLNGMRFVDCKSGKFSLKEFTPEEFCSWLERTGSYCSIKYKLQGKPSMLLDKSIQILRNVRYPQNVR